LKQTRVNTAADCVQNRRLTETAGDGMICMHHIDINRLCWTRYIHVMRSIRISFFCTIESSDGKRFL